MDKKKIEELVEIFAKEMKSPEDLSELSRMLVKATIEKALNAELDDHLGYSKNSHSGHNSGNNRNGYSPKTLKTDSGEIELDTPRDRNGSFEPAFVKKHQTRLPEVENKILALYARGMTTRDIADTFHEFYDADVSPTLISKITDAVIEEVLEWQNRPLDAVYPVIYLDCIVVKVTQDKRVINKSIYLALGINTEGHKELLGMWISENEGSKFWLSVLTEIQNRGVKDIFIACVDGLSGFPEAINTVYPKTAVQLCIVHMVRNSLKYVSYKDRKAVAADLKQIYSSVTAEQAAHELDKLADKWDSKYPAISRSWQAHWDNVIPLFDYPDEIRKIIYTTNAIESLNSVIRKAIKNRKIFPSDKSAFKVVYLAMKQASKKWTMPIRNWLPAMNRFIMEYGDRVDV
ncbi:transposase mutator type [Denitrovibrio acetiphilus DSM 12809]|uniref:Mutator family transposase n=1 Tax=Denitrovibrio acetiphilus (strain DSM 12809 / NBRC 114555 / N2460) TaxID=522772 RepID=D4H4Q7_DENA2|nr:IS256 family transposase [Denitrovibrio acetiphilus]ADD67451.1 transposase mutator type [Denitrovibrio acetiphilus DSM 12809]